MNRQRIILVSIVLSVGAGCIPIHPRVDTRAGDAVVEARGAQTLYPAGMNVNAGPPGIDARAAKESIDRYIDSFKAPPPTMNVINIGGSLTEGGSGR
ncbi:MAG: hypothetical protein JWN94_580 [Betaproteobacteria bacterium]|nr:hypothetical protein [Betaproteobacteria bacterium]